MVGWSLALLLVAGACASPPQVTRKAVYPKRSSSDSALLEWGNSAIIHNADGVVARFGPAATHPEFELGIEADLVTASPRQGCDPLTNSKAAFTQIIVMHRGGCSFRQKVATAEAAGAAALIVVNNDRRSPDRAFAMSLDAEDEEPPPEGAEAEEGKKIRVPSLMVSYAAGQQLREHSPRRMRIFAGGDRPFIESVTDAAPLLYLVHNALAPAEAEAAKALLAPYLLPHPPRGGEAAADAKITRATRTLGVLKGTALRAFCERVASIVGYPVEHLSELALERRRPGASYTVREDRKLGPLNPRGVEDGRGRTIMTVYAYLDDVEEESGGALYFPRARPAAVSVRPAKGLAAIFYSALEDGKLDRSAAHGDGPLKHGAEAWVLVLRVFDRPRPLARRVILPLLLWPMFRGAPPKALALASHRFFARAVGDASADQVIDVALYAVAALAFAPLAYLAYLAFKAYEKSKLPPKRVVSAPAATKKGKKKSS